MKTGSIILIIIGCIYAVISIIDIILFDFLFPYIFGILIAILLIIRAVFRNKGYINKNFFMANFIVIALWGLMLLYIFLFRPQDYSELMDLFLLMIGLFIVVIIYVSGLLIYRLKKGNL
jgi:hypothetical protein